MTDPFSSAKTVLRRANKHIADLNLAVEGFKAGEHYSTVIRFDPDFGKHLLKAKFNTQVFEDMSCIMFDAVSNLRACLDQMTHAVADNHRGRSKNFAYFPFAKDASFWPARINGMQNDLPIEVLNLFGCFQPYKGGNDTLWAVDHLANVNKHALLVPVGVGTGATLTFPQGGPPAGEFISVPAHLNRKDEIILAVRPETPLPRIRLRTYVVIDHAEEVLQGRQPLGLLEIMSGYVAKVLRDTESVCQAIGLFPSSGTG
jgi:hypothetical protein